MYWFLYDSTGAIREAQIVDVTEWTNLNGYAGAISGGAPDSLWSDAFNNPSKYRVVDGALLAQPYFTAAYADGIVTATLNNPPTTPPTEATFAVAGQTYTATITGGQAALALAVHPTVADQTINVTVSATGCVDGICNIGGTATDISDFQVVTPSGGSATVGPAGSGAIPYLQAYFALNATTVEAALTNAMTAISVLYDAVFNILLPSIQQTSYTPVTLDANQVNALAALKYKLLGALPTTLENGDPSGGTTQMQFGAFIENFQNATTNVSAFMDTLSTFNLTGSGSNGSANS